MFLRTFYITVVFIHYFSEENLIYEEEIKNVESPGPPTIKRVKQEIMSPLISCF